MKTDKTRRNPGDDPWARWPVPYLASMPPATSLELDQMIANSSSLEPWPQGPGTWRHHGAVEQRFAADHCRTCHRLSNLADCLVSQRHPTTSFEPISASDGGSIWSMLFRKSPARCKGLYHVEPGAFCCWQFYQLQVYTILQGRRARQRSTDSRDRFFALWGLIIIVDPARGRTPYRLQKDHFAEWLPACTSASWYEGTCAARKGAMRWHQGVDNNSPVECMATLTASRSPTLRLPGALSLPTLSKNTRLGSRTHDMEWLVGSFCQKTLAKPDCSQ